MFKILIVFIGILLIGCDQSTDNNGNKLGSIYGNVYDISGAPISKSLVELMPSGKQTLTGNDGSYEFSDIEPKQYYLTANKAGYFDDYNSVVVFSGQASKLDFVLESNDDVELTLDVFPKELFFEFNEDSKSLRISRLNPSSKPIDYSVTIAGNNSWINVFPKNGQVSTETDEIVISINRDNIPSGNYNVNLIINSLLSKSIIVDLLIKIGDKPFLNVSPMVENFGKTEEKKQLQLKNEGTLDVNWTVESKPSWLLISNMSGKLIPKESTPINLTVSRVNLSPGVYNDFLKLKYDDKTITINISVEIGESENGPKIQLDKNILNFTEGVNNLFFDIKNVGNSDLNWNITSNKTWISLSSYSGNNDKRINVSVDKNSISPNETDGLINIISNGGNGELKVTVEKANLIPKLQVTPLKFELGTNDSTGIIQIDNIGNGDLIWNASNTYLKLNPKSGVNKGFINFEFVRSFWSPGAYSEKIKVNSNGGNIDVLVNFTVLENYLTEEIEPNDNHNNANLVATNSFITGIIGPTANLDDWFKVVINKNGYFSISNSNISNHTPCEVGNTYLYDSSLKWIEIFPYLHVKGSSKTSNKIYVNKGDVFYIKVQPVNSRSGEYRIETYLE